MTKKKPESNEFENLVKPIQNKVYSFLSRMCNDPTRAEDMLQETLLKAYDKLPTFEKRAKFSTWLFQIAANNCLMLKRKEKAKPTQSLENETETTLDPADTANDPHDLMEQTELKEYLNEALQGLPETYRAAVVLKDIEGFTAEEISAMLSISLPNAKARILRGRSLLSKQLKAKGLTPPY